MSRRSPITSACLASNRVTASVKMATSGLPATIGSRPTAVCTAETRVPLPGAIPRATGMVQSVFVAIHGMRGAVGGGVQREGGLGQVHPADLRGEPLDDGGRGVIRGAGDHEAGLLDLGDEAFTPDDEDARTGRRLLREEPHRRLRRGDDIRRGDRETELGQVVGDGLVGPGGIVGDVARRAAFRRRD